MNNNADESVRSSSQTSEKTCRICYEAESAEDIIIEPCECSGSMKYIHEKCLKTWILSQNKQPTSYTCDICKYSIKMQIRMMNHFSLKNLNKELYKMITLFIVICIVLIIFIYLILIVSSVANFNTSTGGKIYMSIIALVCIFTIIVLSVILFKSIKSGCFEPVISDWTIFSNAKQAVNDDITNLTELYDNKGEKSKITRLNKYIIGLDDAQFMIKNPEIEALDSEIPINFCIREDIQHTPRLPNEV